MHTVSAEKHKTYNNGDHGSCDGMKNDSAHSSNRGIQLRYYVQGDG